MKICSEKHDEIVYEAGICPLCEALYNINELETKLDSVREELDQVKENLDNLNMDYRSY